MDEDFYQRLLDASFRFVSYRPRSEKEISDFLSKTLRRWKIAGHLTVSSVIRRLRELDYIDDTKFVLWWIEQRTRFKPKGRRLIRLELVQKGVDRKIIDQGLDSFYRQNHPDLLSGNPGDTTEIANARSALRKKLPVWQTVQGIRKKKKIYDFLARRGFSSDIIYRIIDEVMLNRYNTGTQKE